MAPSAGMAIEVPLTISNRESVAHPSTPVTSGIPFAQGVLRDAHLVRLMSGGAEIPVQVLPTATWPDGSVRWLLIDFQTDLPAPVSASTPGSASVILQTGIAAAAVTGITVEDLPSTLTVRTRSATFTFDKALFQIQGKPFEVIRGGVAYRAVPSPNGWHIDESGPMKTVVRVEGVFRSGSLPLENDLVRYRALLVFTRDSSSVRSTVTFRNNGGFNWAGGTVRGPDIVLSGASLGTTVLLPAGRYVFGPGVEKSWEVDVAASGTGLLRDFRLLADGSLAPGMVPPPPLAQATPAYVSSTKAWGTITPPVNGLPLERQEVFDLFEKLQRAKVLSADVENPPNQLGITVFGHLAQDLSSWNDYGDLRWDGNGCGTLSGNHYDWSYGMYLQFLRTGQLAFADAARIFARHELDFDLYHTGADGTAFNFQKNWEDRPSHDSPDNCFGGGRPTHTWTQGYALQWLLTGDRRALIGFNELQEGIRQYLFESFNPEGHVDTSELRTQGWIVENLVARYRIEPGAALATHENETETIPETIQAIFTSVFAREAAAGGHGYVFDALPGGDGSQTDPNLRAPLQHLYLLGPLFEAYSEIFKKSSPVYGSQLFALAQRMTDWLLSITYGGDTNAGGLYRPRQIPYVYDARYTPETARQGQVIYSLIAADAAATCFEETALPVYRNSAQALFSDSVRYFGILPPDTHGDPASRTPTAYNVPVFPGTESKIHGWTSRFGQHLLAIERGSTGCVPTATSLCLLDNRFRVEARYKDYGGHAGTGQAVSLTADTGYFWFFDQKNVESVVKMVNFCGGGTDNVAVYAGGLTDVEVDLVVTDVSTGVSRDYRNPLGTPFQLIRDGPFSCLGPVSPVAGATPLRSDVLDLGGLPWWRLDMPLLETTATGTLAACEPGAMTLCLLGGRFEVQTTYSDYAGKVGTGRAVALTADTGTFWFFDPSNVEVVTKMVSFCGGGTNNIGLYASGLTDINVTILVRDTQTGLTKTYSNILGSPFNLIRDGSFVCQ